MTSSSALSWSSPMAPMSSTTRWNCLRSNFDPAAPAPERDLRARPALRVCRDGLAGHSQVAIDLGREVFRRVAGALAQERQSQLRPPTFAWMEPFGAGNSHLAMQPDVDDHPRRSQRLAGEPTQFVDGTSR